MKNAKKMKMSFNSPVILSFAFASFMILLFDQVFGGALTRALFSVYRSSFWDPLTYLRFFGHVLGHANWDHLIGNMMMFLVIGPLLEDKYGSMNILMVILSTAFVTGVIHFLLFPKVALLGASGIVFAFILFASMTSLKEGEIPITFILVALFYIGKEVHQGLYTSDNISNLTHIIGGLVGAYLGYQLNLYQAKHR